MIPLWDRMEYEIGSDESPSLAVSKAADMYSEADPRDTETLHEVVDADALNELFAAVDEDTPRSSGRVSFVYRGCRVTVSHGEYLTITRAAADEVQELPHTL